MRLNINHVDYMLIVCVRKNYVREQHQCKTFVDYDIDDYNGRDIAMDS